MAARKRSKPTFSTLADLLRGTEEHNRETERLYPDHVVTRIADTLPKFQSDDVKANFPRQIRDWAVGYSGLRRITSPKYKQAFERAARARRELRKAAATLISAYHTYCALDPAGSLRLAQYMAGKNPDPFSVPSDADMNLLRLAVEGVRCLADAASAEIGRRRDPRRQIARRVGVKALVTIYKEATGDRATLTWSQYANNNRGGYRGRFRDFCIAALTPIEGEEQSQGRHRQADKAHTLWSPLAAPLGDLWTIIQAADGRLEDAIATAPNGARERTSDGRQQNLPGRRNAPRRQHQRWGNYARPASRRTRGRRLPESIGQDTEALALVSPRATVVSRRRNGRSIRLSLLSEFVDAGRQETSAA